ncbi:hypothetical protein [Kitasatospora azatica]|uniref:hypothetical protein n=1 Tax=Kitasatospora azatica TaxID=58347 RepID=UPI000569B3D1|nr:hypothetical protein [Kitasatospora azatica]
MACPQCGGENIRTARQLYELTEPAPPGLDPARLAPPPAPPGTNTLTAGQAQSNGKAKALIAIGGGLVVLRLLTLAANGYTGTGPSYTISWLGLILPVILLVRGVVLFNRNRAAAPYQPVDDQALANRALYTRRMQVWEHAQVCRDCKGAFFAEGVLHPGIPASPLITLDQFPLMVVTMAERAYGRAA